MSGFDDYFHYNGDELSCENRTLRSLAQEYGTPLYVYSERGFAESYSAIAGALEGVPHLVCFSIKSNSNLSIIRLMKGMGSGVDVVSVGELFRALKAGAEADRIVFAGVGKTAEEISYAIDSKIHMFNCESVQEIDVIDSISAAKITITDIAIRVNPDVDADTHHYITTGKKENKFGIAIDRLGDYLSAIQSRKNIRLRGIHTHIGSQITSVDPYRKTLEKISLLIRDLKGAGFQYIDHFNLGGVFGIVYRDEKPFSFSEWAAEVKKHIAPMGLRLIIEPGRFLSGNNGIFVVKVLYKKEGENKTFLITDGGMNDLIRPSLYGAFQNVRNCVRRSGTEVVDVVGPVCESGDFFAKDREISKTQQGDYLAVFSAGAYCMAMASRYNSRRLPAEVMVGPDGSLRLIRRRESWDDLIQHELV
jgi:diaminopimelate decarboxylase